MYSDARNGYATLKFNLDRTTTQPTLLIAYTGIAASIAGVVTSWPTNFPGVLRASALTSPTWFMPIFKSMWAVAAVAATRIIITKDSKR